MLDTEYLKQLLEKIGEGSYAGVDNGDLLDQFAPDEGEPIEYSENGLKFKYHMDEAWAAGLFRSRDLRTTEGWGLKVGARSSWVIVTQKLVLTPIGGELLDELNKPKGLERLKDGLRKAGASAGSEALRFAVGAVLKGSLG